VLMPRLDGKEMCRRLKANELTAHIPVIMLTALKSDEQELKAPQGGADEYLCKPVNVKSLRRRLENIVTLREKYHERFAQELKQTRADDEPQRMPEVASSAAFRPAGICRPTRARTSTPATRTRPTRWTARARGPTTRCCATRSSR